MDRKITVFKGAEIPCMEGVLKITDINCAGLIYADEFTVTEAGDLDFNTERRLTAAELANELWMIDGKIHKVVID